ncbi:hypothetical protein [Rufibacter roseolus]|uniref:hypothetical protein n=1 Tax=Rufibacter roseolus TaxID=2817375 RepID=UPI001B30E816|nr:hypothetical protein [Rufibacter roseolus]
MFLKRRAIWFIALTAFLSIFVLSAAIFPIVGADNASDIPIEKPCPPKTIFNLEAALLKVDKQKLIKSFPYEAYLKGGNICDVNAISRNISAMDSVFPGDPLLNQQILSIALTHKLEERIKPSFKGFNPDSLIQVLQWAEKFNAYAEIDQSKAMFYQVIYGHWMNFISNTLRQAYKEDPSIAYDYKFKYINSRCKEKQFGTPITFTNTEKVVNNLVESKWAYLFSKFWHDTGFAGKLAAFSCLAFILFPYMLSLRQSNRK